MKTFSSALFLATCVGPAASFAPLVGNAPVAGSRPAFSSTSLFERKPFITGNWKLNPTTRDECSDLAAAIAKSVDASKDVDVALFVPSVFIKATQDAVGDKLSVGAETVCAQLKGAFTGEVSAPQLKSVGVEWALAGHSERRTVFHEVDSYIQSQVRRLMDENMSVVICIGETLSEYEKGLASAVCSTQLRKGLSGLTAEEMGRVVVAYEPVWAIGTGKVATPETAQSVHESVRSILSDMYGESVAAETRILYGGSVTPESVDELMDQPDIDGVLVGGASLDAEKFGRIINFQPMKVAA
mmetsp:Transcript_36590/g.85524  ORF Transcript_36590/g.85524 Transcript_36590/m.85524 type:complete len:299 (-) Transcript_36590:213-1109(-)|eukprot:CAMPEP_0113310880 /NCGR_PEP_ID=MMETSP0010_2-20120614/8349_1 /TAXON_ID=216773 ORGANISM="Corethron hystrix, Strain 308" /NCGR_SAMPLE_ID=MMETSP0010_2 /ASSEMBLY_ACC=CAM_ASM_000155 /LENGTH=298 /DNA_ID=CAMNT_0000166425 /DNA_START=60 /DNA_END=956 /DNA_ORIENTATION=- /assembly_acc=CAM_ASM_000155